MVDPLTEAEVKQYLEVARRAARQVSRDPEVVKGAADQAVHKLGALLDSVSEERPKREGWVRVVARNEARRTGAKLNREEPFGRQGSLPPRVGDETIDVFVATVISEMHQGGPSLGSLVADKVDFEAAWELLGRQARALLEAKYVERSTSKEIARDLGLAPGTVDNKLTAAKEAARPLFQDLYEQRYG